MGQHYLDFFVDKLKYRFDIVININWALVLGFVIFWSWGLYGYSTGTNFDYILNCLFVLFFFYFLTQIDNSNYVTSIDLHIYPVFVACFCTVALVFTWNNLNDGLFCDQIYHSANALRHSQLVLSFINLKLPWLWNSLKGLTATWVLWSINLIFFIFLAGLFCVLPRIRFGHKKLFLATMVLVIVATRILITSPQIFLDSVSPEFKENFFTDIHPPFRNFPLWLFGTLFSPSSFSFRLCEFIAYLSFLMGLHSFLIKKTSFTVAFLAITAIGTIPIFWHVSYLVEPSIWAVISSSVVFIALYGENKPSLDLYMCLVSFLIVATLMRIPAFLGAIPVLGMFLFNISRGNFRQKDQWGQLVAPLVFFVLIVGITVYRGSPATDYEGSALMKTLNATINNLQATKIVEVVGIFPFFFVGVLFIVETWRKCVLVLMALLFFGATNFVYYGPVKEYLWVISRYQAEIAIPLISLSIVAYALSPGAATPKLMQFRDNLKLRSIIVPMFLGCLVLNNFFSILTIDSTDYAGVRLPGKHGKFKSQEEYPYAAATKYLTDEGLFPNVYFITCYYGGLEGLLSGLSAENCVKFSELNKKYRLSLLQVDFKGLTLDDNVNAVMIEGFLSDEAKRELSHLGWQVSEEFIHPKSKKRIFIMVRS